MSLALSMLALAQTPEDSAQARAANDYRAAMVCVSEFAEAATFQRRNIYAIAEDAVKECAAQSALAAESLIEGVAGGSDAATSRDYIGAKSRVTVWHIIINRLENGEAVYIPVGLDPAIGVAQARYIECSRSAGGVKFSSVFFGDGWLTATLKKPAKEQLEVFEELGRQTCPKSYKRLVDATRAAARGKGRAAQQRLEDDLAGAERFAAQTWLK